MHSIWHRDPFKCTSTWWLSAAIGYRVMSAGGRKRSYDAAFKLAAVEDAEKTTNRAAARKFMVDERRLLT